MGFVQDNPSYETEDDKIGVLLEVLFRLDLKLADFPEPGAPLDEELHARCRAEYAD